MAAAAGPGRDPRAGPEEGPEEPRAGPEEEPADPEEEPAGPGRDPPADPEEVLQEPGREPRAGPEEEPRPAGPGLVPEEELPPLSPEEVRSRLERSEKQFRNRRKVLIKGLPADVSNQEVHDLLSDYDLKYCFVDKYKGTAFVTLQSGEQASSAVRSLHGARLRSRELRVQLQPSDSLLCVANLPRLLSQRQFEELVRPFGSVERCSLVFSPRSGHSKGYGFVEYMKQEAAARARAGLQGRRVGTRSLAVHWAEAAQLSPERLHSRCLCVDRLPRGYGDLRGLRALFGAVREPTFCQLAYGQDRQLKGFAVLELESPEWAERVQEATDGFPLAGSHIRVSFCAPGTPGRSALAALIAAQATAPNRGKGLLPEPNLLQILRSLGNPASLQLLLPALLHGKQGILGAAPALPLLSGPALPAALLQLALHGHSQKPGILGDSPLSSLPLGLASAPAQPPGKLLGDIPAGGSLVGEGPGKSQGIPCQAIPCGNAALAALLAQDRPGSGPGSGLGSGLGSGSGAGTPPGPPGLGHVGAAAKAKQGEVSLLGEPPKEFRIPLNPYLNLHSLLPTPGAASKGFKGGVPTPRAAPNDAPPLLPPPTTDAFDFPADLSSRIFPQPRDPSGPILGGFGPSRNKVPSPCPGLDRGVLGSPLAPFLSGSPNSCFSRGLQAGLGQSQLSKTIGIPPNSPDTVLTLAPPTPHSKTPLGGQKRTFSQLLPPPEPSPEGCYVGQHSQGLGGHYADSHLKRKRIF